MHSMMNCLLGGVPSKVLNRGLATSIGSVEASESTQQSCHDRDDLSTIRNMLSSFFQDEERSFRVDPAQPQSAPNAG